MREKEERGGKGKGGEVEREGGEPPHFYNEVYAYVRASL